MTDGYVDAGKLEVQVVADLRGFAADLRTKLTAATKGVEATVGIKADTKTLKAQLKALKSENLTIPVGISLDVRQAKAHLKALKSEDLKIPVEIDLDAKAIKAKLSALGRARNLTIPVGLNISGRGVQAQLRAISKAENLVLPVKLEIDTRGLKAQLAAAAKGAGPINVPVNPDPAPGGGADPKNQKQRTQGVKDYDSALKQMTASLRDLEKANLNAETAQRNLSAAQKRYTQSSPQARRATLAFVEAEDKLLAARKAGTDAQADLAREAGKARLGAAPEVKVKIDADTKKAAADLDVLTRPRRISIKVDFDRATLTNGLRQVSELMGRISSISTIPLFGGLIAGAVGVVGALGSISAAIAPVVNNLLLLPAAAGAGAVALGSLVVGFEGLGAAVKALSAKDLTKWRQALEKLTPAAQDVALAMYQIQPTLTSVRKAVQESLLVGVGGDMRKFASVYLGADGYLGRALTGSAKSWNAAIRSTFDYLQDTTTQPVVASGLRQVDEAGKALSQTLRPLTNIFVQLFAGGMPYVTRMAKAIASATQRLSDFTQTARQSGAMSAFFERGIDTAKQLGRILRDLTIGLGNFFRAGTAEGKGMLDSIEEALARFREFTSSPEGQAKFKQFWRDTRLLMDGVVDTIVILSKAAAGIGGFFSSWSEDLKKATVPATVLAGLIGKIAGGVGRIIGGALTMTAASTMTTAAALQNTASLNMLRAAGIQAGAALGGAGGAAGGAAAGGLRGAAARLGIGAAATGVGGAAVSGGLISTTLTALWPVLLGAAAIGALSLISIKVLGKISKDANKPAPKDKEGFTIQQVGSGGGMFDAKNLTKVEAARTKEIHDIEQKFAVHLGQITGKTARDEFGKIYQLQSADPGALKERSEDLRAAAKSYEVGTKAATEALKTATGPYKTQLQFDITDFTAKAAVVFNDRVKLEEAPTVVMLQANVKNATDAIAQVERMLKDPAITGQRRIDLVADLSKLKGVKLEAGLLLDIKDRVVKITANKDDLDSKIKTLQEQLKTPGLLPVVETSLRLQLGEFTQQRDQAKHDLADLSAQKINPKVVEVQTKMAEAQGKIAELQRQLDDPETGIARKKHIINVEMPNAQKELTGYINALAELPGYVYLTGAAVGNSVAKGLESQTAAIRAVGYAHNAAYYEALIANTPKTYEYLQTRSTYEKLIKDSRDAAAKARDDMKAQAGPSMKDIRTGPPGAGKEGWKDTAADKAAKAAEAQRKREEAAAKRAQAAREKAEREAARRAEAVRNAVQLIANKGFISGLTGALGTIKSTAKSMIGFVKTALGKGALPLTTRIQADTTRLVALAQQRDTIVKKLTTAQDKLKDLVEKAAQTRAQIAETIRSSFSLLDNAATDTAASMIDRLTKAVDAAKRFTASIQTLRSRGLNADLLGQLAAGGPAAQGTADILTQASGEELSKVNQLYGDLKTQADTGGKVVADALYGVGIQAAQGLVNGLLAQQKAVEASMTTIAVAMQAAIKIALKIKSPSVVMYDLGIDTMTGYDQGLMAPTAGITKNLMTWATTTMTSVVGAFQTGVTGVAAAWAGIVEATKAPVRTVIEVAINGGIIAAYNSVAAQFGVKGATPFTIPKALQASAPVKRATGGPVYGAGTATSDSIPALLSTGEHVLAAREVAGLGGHGAVEAIRAAARRGGARFAAGGGLSGSGPATYPSMVAWLKKNFPQARASTYQPSFGYHRAPPGGYAADVFAPGVGEGAPAAMAVFEGIRNTFKKSIQELIYTWAGPRQVWNGQDYTFTGSALQASHRTHIHWSMLADGFGAGMGELLNPVKENIDKALAGLKDNPNLKSPFGQMLAAGATQLGKLVGPAAQEKLTAGPDTLTGDPSGMKLPKGTDLAGLPPSVTRWAPTVLAVLKQLGQPESNLGAVLRRINFESSGRPDAINLTDSNARAGHPSQGLMQTIPTTFAAHAGPYAARGITDPYANIYAGLHYAIGRYGSIAAIDPRVRPSGYDKGGWLNPGQLGINKTNKPEAVFSGGEFDRLISALETTAGRPAVVAGRGAAPLGMRPLASLTVPSQRASSAQIDTTAAAPVINVYPRATQSEAEIARGVSRELAWQGRKW